MTAKMSNEFQKNYPGNWRARLTSYIARNFNPSEWTLSFRFIVVPGIIILVMVIFTSAFFFLSTKRNTQEYLIQRLEMSQMLMESQLNERFRFLSFEIRRMAQREDLAVLFKSKDPAGVNELIEADLDVIRQVPGFSSLSFCVYLYPDSNTPDTADWNCSIRDEVLKPFLKNAWDRRESGHDIYVGRFGLNRIAFMPVTHRMETVGVFVVRASIDELISQVDQPGGMSITPVVRDTFSDKLDRSLTKTGFGSWTAYDYRHVQTSMPSRHLDVQNIISLEKNKSYLLHSFINNQGQVVGGAVLGVDHSMSTGRNQAYFRYISFIVLNMGLLVMLTLYLSLNKVKIFFSKLKKMIIASHSNDFSDRFETDPVHCLEVMKCRHEECPVYENPDLVCYLETGSEAISPQWRGTCLFLNKYESCRNCPVYTLKRGDELDEMRNVVNTMMRLWRVFLDRSGRLLSQVLKIEGSAYHVPSLDDVAKRMEQMARLTAFSHDIRGVYQKEEVYQQLKRVFGGIFKIDHFILFEVNSSQNRITAVVDSHPSEGLCKKDIMITPDVCRAKRMSEDVSSADNHALCPFFNCDHSTYIRYCIPLVMGGQVGSVFSFMVPRSEWPWRREQVIILRKYMEECAPILTTLRLIDITREESLRDPLTHCHNRRFLDEYIHQYEPLSVREQKTVGFLMADLDYFKQVNDKYGHQVGDSMLKQVVSIIMQNIRSSDLLVRYGGEEFLILLPQVEQGKSIQVAENIRSSIESYDFDLGNGNTLKKTISLGVAEFPHDADTMYKAIKYCDVALYEAKKAGRNKVVSFEKEMWTASEY